jgi:Fe2+ transport system protein B
MALLAAKMSKIEEASKKREEQENNFISQTREALEQRMEAHIEKRESIINDLRSKIKEHVCIRQFYSFLFVNYFVFATVFNWT